MIGSLLIGILAGLGQVPSETYELLNPTTSKLAKATVTLTEQGTQIGFTMEKVNEPALLEVWFVDFFNQESCVYASVGLSDFDAKLKTDNKVRMSLGSLTDSKVVGEVKQTNTHVTFQVYKTIDQKPKVAILRLPQQSQKMNLARKLADFKDVLLFKDFLKIDLPNMTP